jgi:hypothetical protein
MVEDGNTFDRARGSMNPSINIVETPADPSVAILAQVPLGLSFDKPVKESDALVPLTISYFACNASETKPIASACRVGRSKDNISSADFGAGPKYIATGDVFDASGSESYKVDATCHRGYDNEERPIDEPFRREVGGHGRKPKRRCCSTDEEEIALREFWDDIGKRGKTKSRKVRETASPTSTTSCARLPRRVDKGSRKCRALSKIVLIAYRQRLTIPAGWFSLRLPQVIMETDDVIDDSLVKFCNWQYFYGHHVTTGEYTIAAYVHQNARFARFGMSSLPRTWKTS